MGVSVKREVNYRSYGMRNQVFDTRRWVFKMSHLT